VFGENVTLDCSEEEFYRRLVCKVIVARSSRSVTAGPAKDIPQLPFRFYI
jgi:hypothetical protein